MPDLSKTRARPTRLSRGRARVPEAAGPQVTSRDFARDTSNVGAASGAAAASRLFGAMSGFVSQEGNRQAAFERKKKDLLMREQIMRENRDIAATTKATAPQDLQRALENNEPLPGIPLELQNRDSFRINAMDIVGRNQASRASEDPKWTGALANSKDPFALLDEHVTEATKDMDPVMAASYAEQFRAKNHKAASERVFNVQKERVLETDALLQETIESAPPTNIDEAQEYEAQKMLLWGTLGETAREAARADYWGDIMRRAHEGDVAANKILDTKNDDGVSPRMRYSELDEAIEQEVISGLDDVKTAQDAEAINEALEAAALGDVKGAWDLVNKRYEENPSFFESSKARALLGELNKAAQGQITLDAYFQSLEQNEPAGWHPDEQRKMGLEMLDQYMPWLVNKGHSQEDAFSMMSAALRSTDVSPDMEKRIFQLLQDENTSAAWHQVLLGTGDAAYDILNNQGDELWSFMQEFGPEQGLKKYEEARTSQRPQGLTYENVLQKHGYTRGGDNTLGELVTDVADGAIEKSGAFEGIDGISPFDSPDADDAAEVSLLVRARTEELMRQKALVYPNEPIERIADMVSNQMAGEVEPTWDEDRGFVVGLKERGEKGFSGADMEYMKKAVEAVKGDKVDRALNGVSKKRGVRGSPGTTVDQSQAHIRIRSLQRDEYTSDDAGYQAGLVNELGIEHSGQYAIGVPVLVDLESAAFAQWVPVEGAQADESGLTMAMPPLANMTIDGGVSGLSWYVADGMAMLRYIGPDLDTQLNERVDERRMRRFSGQGSAPAGKRGTHVRGLGEQAATAEMKSNMPVASLDFAAKTEFMAKPARGAEEATAQYVAAKEQTEWRAQYMLDLSSPQGREFSAKYNDFLDIAEGEDAAVVYDDATGRSLSPGEKPKGKRTIARGYNMDRGDWAEMSKRIGLTPHEAQKVFNGERALTEGQKLRLNTILMEDTAKKVHAMYRPEKGFPPLPRAFYIARMSLYHHGVRNTPAMDKAIKAGDWDAVAMEIIDRSMKGFKGTVWEKGVQKRRLKEAVLATGGRSKDPRLVGVDPWKK